MFNMGRRLRRDTESNWKQEEVQHIRHLKVAKYYLKKEQGEPEELKRETPSYSFSSLSLLSSSIALALIPYPLSNVNFAVQLTIQRTNIKNAV